MYAGGWAAGVLFTRLQWSLSIWKSASLSWAGQTDLWKVTHILEGIISATHTPLSSTPSTVLTTADLHSLLTSQQQSPTRKATEWRLTGKRFFFTSRKISDVIFYKLFRKSQVGKAKQYFQKRKVSGVRLNWNTLWFLMLPAMWNLLKNTV